MRIGDEVRVSTPVSMASARSKPLICLANCGIASRMALITYSGKAVSKLVKCTLGVYEGVTAPNSVEG